MTQCLCMCINKLFYVAQCSLFHLFFIRKKFPLTLSSWKCYLHITPRYFFTTGRKNGLTVSNILLVKLVRRVLLNGEY